MSTSTITVKGLAERLEAARIVLEAIAEPLEGRVNGRLTIETSSLPETSDLVHVNVLGVAPDLLDNLVNGVSIVLAIVGEHEISSARDADEILRWVTVSLAGAGIELHFYRR